ncbi:hypothetical protein HY989_06555 [Candidatus Micrarchaeota archaeon]|nr:hypothetical protein [Candidatus Micrarchaeota archaeon]
MRVVSAVTTSQALFGDGGLGPGSPDIGRNMPEPNSEFAKLFCPFVGVGEIVAAGDGEIAGVGAIEGIIETIGVGENVGEGDASIVGVGADICVGVGEKVGEGEISIVGEGVGKGVIAGIGAGEGEGVGSRVDDTEGVGEKVGTIVAFPIDEFVELESSVWFKSSPEIVEEIDKSKSTARTNGASKRTLPRIGNLTLDLPVKL